MGYHASGRPTYRTSSIIEVRDYRANPRYGADVSASRYAREDANGMSLGIIRDVPIRDRKPRKRSTAKPVKLPNGKPRVLVDEGARAARERKLVGPITWLATDV